MQQKSLKMAGTLEHQQTIIQCPQCQTKFAVDGSLLAGVSSPRFHCSRCDHLFAAESKPAPAPRMVAHSILDERPSVDETKPFAVTETGAEAKLLAAAAPQMTAAEVASPQVTAPRVTKDEPPSWSLGLPTKERAPEREFTPPAAVHSIAAPISTPEIGKDQPDYKQMDFDFKRSYEAKHTFTTSAFDEPVMSKTNARAPVESLAADDFPANFEYRRPSSRWNSLMITATPLVFFLTILVGASYYLRGNATGAEGIFTSLSKSSVQVAPPNLNIVNARFKSVILDSGETAYLVSGTLKNQSEHTLQEVVLEGIGFSEDGDLVSRTRVDAGATLAKTRIRSLTSDMIKNLQSGQLKNKTVLKPGDSEEFTFALLNGDAAKARYFSARVYSVTF